MRLKCTKVASEEQPAGKSYHKWLPRELWATEHQPLPTPAGCSAGDGHHGAAPQSRGIKGEYQHSPLQSCLIPLLNCHETAQFHIKSPESEIHLLLHPSVMPTEALVISWRSERNGGNTSPPWQGQTAQTPAQFLTNKQPSLMFALPGQAQPNLEAEAKRWGQAGSWGAWCCGVSR